ncbi:MAG TPA: hypothetical protein VM008_15210 [Phycisphaerae bacterium]|nr:hypothetical protein [Phycisphaerae bacterium]
MRLRLALLVGMVGLVGCEASRPAAPVVKGPAAPAELVDRKYLFEVVRYLYRWHMDEAEAEKALEAKEFVFWVKRVNVKLDEGDRSELGEIFLPDLGMIVRVKKADYEVAELGITIRNDRFKITEVERVAMPGKAPGDCEVVSVDKQGMMDYLFQTRNKHDYADAALVERMRLAVRKVAAEEGLLKTVKPGETVVHLAPLSPVSNECWIFWEAGHKLFYFSSDIDLVNPAVWEHEQLTARIYDVNEQVIVAPSEAPGSNRFLTRNEVGRALYNCIVLGQRVMVVAQGEAGEKNVGDGSEDGRK